MLVSECTNATAAGPVSEPGTSYPSAERLARLARLDDRQREKLPVIWKRRWGAIDLRWLRNHLVIDASGFCRPDGSITYVGALEDYPTGPELLQDLRILAARFPDLAMDAAIWCTAGRSMLGFPYFDGLDTAWPPELLARVAGPTVGFLLNAGEVTIMRGFDRRLFAAHGLRYPQALDVALGETRRLQTTLVLESDFARRDRRPARCGAAWLDRNGPHAWPRAVIVPDPSHSFSRAHSLAAPTPRSG